MNYRQIITIIIANLNQSERNLDGLRERGQHKDVAELTQRLRTIKVMAAELADRTFDAIQESESRKVAEQ